MCRNLSFRDADTLTAGTVVDAGCNVTIAGEGTIDVAFEEVVVVGLVRVFKVTLAPVVTIAVGAAVASTTGEVVVTVAVVAGGTSSTV